MLEKWPWVIYRVSSAQAVDPARLGQVVGEIAGSTDIVMGRDYSSRDEAVRIIVHDMGTHRNPEAWYARCCLHEEKTKLPSKEDFYFQCAEKLGISVLGDLPEDLHAYGEVLVVDPDGKRWVASEMYDEVNSTPLCTVTYLNLDRTSWMPYEKYLEQCTENKAKWEAEQQALKVEETP